MPPVPLSDGVKMAFTTVRELYCSETWEAKLLADIVPIGERTDWGYEAIRVAIVIDRPEFSGDDVTPELTALSEGIRAAVRSAGVYTDLWMFYVGTEDWADICARNPLSGDGEPIVGRRSSPCYDPWPPDDTVVE